MSARALPAVLALAALAGGVAAQAPPPPGDERARLIEARQAAAVAGARAERLLVAAALETDAAARAAAEQRGLAARVTAAEAGLAAAELRARIVARQLAARRGALAAEQAPLARLLAAIQSLTMRPAAAAVAQPGSVDDLVHLRAVLATTLPAIRARTAEVREQVAGTKALCARAIAAAAALRSGRARLDTERGVLAAAERQHRARAAELGRGALSESDRALALGEAARDLVERLAEQGRGQAVVERLARLPAPLPRDVPAGQAMPPPRPGLYRLPVAGRLLTGFGEISEAGVRSRGLTLAARPGAAVVAPAGGVVRYAAPFRRYGAIIIIDHGGGWSSLVTGLAALKVTVGQSVAAGTPLGAAGGGEEAHVTVELRRKGQPVDAAALIG